MENLYYILVFILGLIFGSFGSVLIWRLADRVDFKILKSIFIGHSQCPNCKTTLGVLDLFPLFSYIFLGGKCRHCGTKISLFYPFLELFSGLIFVFTLFFVQHFLGYINFFDNTFLINFIFFVIVNWLLLLLIFGDLLFYQLVIGLWILLVFWIIGFQFFGILGNFNIAFWGGFIMFLVFTFIYYFGKFYVSIRYKKHGEEGFGGGDVMVGFVIGLLMPFILTSNGLGFVDMFYLVLVYVFLSSILGVLFALFSFIILRGEHGKAIPFLPAMILGFWIILFVGKYLIIFLNNLSLI